MHNPLTPGNPNLRSPEGPSRFAPPVGHAGKHTPAPPGVDWSELGLLPVARFVCAVPVPFSRQPDTIDPSKGTAALDLQCTGEVQGQRSVIKSQGACDLVHLTRNSKVSLLISYVASPLLPSLEEMFAFHMGVVKMNQKLSSSFTEI